MKTPYDIIVRPIVTEKSVRLANMEVKSSKTKETKKITKITFEVAMDATKPEIKEAVEKIFNVKVDKVNTMVVKGKRKGIRLLRGKKRDWKKAVVTLKPGYEIDLENL
ncbi:50S ribosomal protein L23 [Desulfurobacterium indicum]|uniref:Large ribosomal subunit protein uL23 n=1 Tax=Desulfurobacterium indicum TaxID=1914305 RepID=A0A1R1MKA6_9BACT|nr:50S ribosomal protein L23 [Desulfurobacterium indicum]OMH40245.1 50S ribosomal protein L23 [Desulfurobacterium indicum]